MQMKRGLWVLGGVAVLLSGLGIFSNYLLTAQRIRQDLLSPPILIRNEVGQVKDKIIVRPNLESTFCPGGTVYWTVQREVLRDADVQTWRTLKSGVVGSGRTVRDRETRAPYINIEYASLEAGTNGNVTLGMELPEWIRPGLFYILTSIQTGSARPVRYIVAFPVEASCTRPPLVPGEHSTGRFAPK
jgi:hypothetical protein